MGSGRTIESIQAAKYSRMKHKISPYWSEIQILAAYETLHLHAPSIARGRGIKGDDIDYCISDAMLVILESDIEFPNPKYDRIEFIKNTLWFVMGEFNAAKKRRLRQVKRYASKVYGVDLSALQPKKDVV